MSAIFTHSVGQKRLAIETKSLEAARGNGRVHTEILPAGRFHLAEAYHQKFALRGRPELLKEYEAIYPSLRDFLASRAVTRVNGYVAGNGTCDFPSSGSSTDSDCPPREGNGWKISSVRTMPGKGEASGRHVRRADAP